MRIALAGFGAWGQMTANALAAIEGAKVVSVYCHGEASELAAREQLPSALRFSDYDDMLRSAQADLVCITVPNHRHAEFAIAALRHGANVFLEKPLGLSLEECDGVIRASRESGRLVALDHEFRVSRQWGAARDLIEKGEIGRLRFQRIILFRRPFRLGSGGWRHDPSRVGSWILEEVVHFVDLALWYAQENGKPTHLRASGTGMRARDGLFDTLTLELFWKDGSSAIISQCLTGFEHHVTVDLTGTEGGMRSWWSGAMDRTMTPSFEVKLRRKGKDPMGPAEVLPIAHSGEVFELEENLRRALAGFREGRSILPPQEARDSIAICLAAAEAALSGREVSITP
ncbi:MAG: Gfo/Idh/MocA family oxidoreductase [Hyphomicrobiales bacterium]|nr:Gfo/Idh/MocA family oxidoreductase [Hyphomicrobiales bacterium]MBV9520854.1 Gfo/Idh/MocA family oxidoreductase [Hyphomicrobiales bacterium]